jgi:aryl-alcohol dehydrogenase
MKVKAAVAHEGDPAFRYEDVEVGPLQENEILVRIAGVGLCHTDLVFKSGAAEYPFPAVLGHEGSGTVEAVGPSVTKVAKGDSVLITFRSCGSCDRCDAGDAPYCRTMPLLNYTGRREDGSSALSNADGDVSSNFFGQSSFASHAVTYERNVVKVSGDMPLEIMGPLGCGIQTGVGAVTRSLAAKKGSSILITGGGSVGLSAVMGAKIADCSIIILLEPQQARRELGSAFGATHCLDPAEVNDLTEAVRAITPLGVDNALDTTGMPEVQAGALASLGSKATLGLVGVSAPGTPLPGEINGVMTFGQSVRGIIEGDSDPETFLPELIEHFKTGRLPFDKMVKTYALEDINQAVADQHAGECVKAVLIP